MLSDCPSQAPAHQSFLCQSELVLNVPLIAHFYPNHYFQEVVVHMTGHLQTFTLSLYFPRTFQNIFFFLSKTWFTANALT